MRVILDSHALLWFLEGSDLLSEKARRTIEEPENAVLVSAASLWEIAIKYSLGRLELAEPFEQLIPNQLRANAIDVLGLELRHISQVAALPFHHKDPFDRLVIAQALVEHLPVVGRDPEFDRYGVERLW